ncbi:MAG: tRNA pseudouridine(55) synthase TruB [Candidatus Eisenbacteria bacterium]
MDGILNIDKPGGMTSHDVVQKVRDLLRGAKVGHAGTLDPNATGVLIVLVGKATKVSRFLMGLEKEYVFTIQLGVETDTLDRWGEVVSTSSPDGVGACEIASVASRFKGRYQQIAPSVSALKHRGVPLYKLVRRGEPTPVKTRVVMIRNFEVLDIRHPHVTIRVVCSSGTYVRSLARDMGKHLGCGASVFSLRRTRIGSFGLEEAVALRDLTEGPSGLKNAMMTIEEGLRHLPKIPMKPGSVERIRTGGQPTAEDFHESDLDFDGDYVALTDEKGTIVGIAKRSGQQGSMLKTERIL